MRYMNPEQIRESLRLAQVELKRAEHQIFVSLKYTRTVDVLKNIIERLISTFDFGFITLLEMAKDKGTVATIPQLPRQRVEAVREAYKDTPEIQNYLEFYLILRKIQKAEFSRAQEYRRHVTMTAKVNDEEILITIDIISDYYQRSREFLQFLEQLESGKPEE